MKKLLLALLLVSGMAHALEPKIAKDDFDGATRVWIAPHGLDCGGTMSCFSIGARWTSNEKDAAVLELQTLNVGYVGVEGVKLNIDGQVLDLKPLGETKYNKPDTSLPPRLWEMLRTSTRDFLIPLELVQVMLDAKSVKVRVITRDGFIDGTLRGGKSRKAEGALSRFIAKVPHQPKKTWAATSSQ